MSTLAIDQGTSSTKALVVGDDGRVLSVAEVAIHPATGPDGAVEQDPWEVLESVTLAGRRALETGGPVEAVGLANQGETVLAWDPSTGAPISAAISWQDRRSHVITAELRALEPRLTQITGLPLDPYFSAPKMTWLRRQGASGGVVTTLDSWLLFHLGNLFVTDATTASRSLLLDLETRRWSAEALQAFSLEGESMPEVVDCAGQLGLTSSFGDDIPITALVVDQQAALIGEGCLDPGEAKCTYGTGAFFLVNTGERRPTSPSGLSASVAWQIGDDHAYCLDGQSYTAGAAITWLMAMGLLDSPEALDSLAGSVSGTQGVRVVPALAGLGAPQWEPSARGSIEGLTQDTRPAHVVRATLEGLAAQVAKLAACAADDLDESLVSLKVDGGLTRSSILMQLQADLLQIPVEVFRSPHATALGVAALARVGLGTDHEINVSGASPEAVFEPTMTPDEAAARLARFDEATLRAIEAAESDRP
jgi:glycerol kinase